MGENAFRVVGSSSPLQPFVCQAAAAPTAPLPASCHAQWKAAQLPAAGSGLSLLYLTEWLPALAEKVGPSSGGPDPAAAGS